MPAPTPPAINDLNDAYALMHAHTCTTCVACGEPLTYWLQASNKAIRDTTGKITGLAPYNLVQCHCTNPDCVLVEKTTDPEGYHAHMAKFLQAGMCNHA